MTTPDPQPDLPALPLTYRPQRARTALLALGAFGFVSLTVIAVLLPAGGAVSWSLGERFAFSLSGLAIWGLLALLARPHAIADTDGLTVVNLTTRRHLPWHRVADVTLGSGEPWVSLRLDDGSSVQVMAIQTANGRAGAIDQARTLRDLARRLGGAAPAGQETAAAAPADAPADRG